MQTIKVFMGVFLALIAFSILKTIASNLIPQPTEAELRMQYQQELMKQNMDNMWKAFEPLCEETPNNCEKY